MASKFENSLQSPQVCSDKQGIEYNYQTGSSFVGHYENFSWTIGLLMDSLCGAISNCHKQLAHFSYKFGLCQLKIIFNCSLIVER